MLINEKINILLQMHDRELINGEDFLEQIAINKETGEISDAHWHYVDACEKVQILMRIQDRKILRDEVVTKAILNLMKEGAE